MKILTVTLLLLVSVAVIVAAQETPVASILAAAKVAAQKYIPADAVYLQNDESVQVDSNGTAVLSIHKTILLLTQAGVDDYDKVKFVYFPTIQTIAIDYARTITMDGVVTRLDSSTVTRAPIAELLGASVPDQANAAMGITFDMPNAHINTIIEYQVTVRGAVSIIPGLAYAKWHPAQKAPVKEALLQVTVPRGSLLRWQASGIDVAPIVQTDSAKTSYTFAVHDMPAVTAPIGTPNSPYILVSNFTSWNRIVTTVGTHLTAAEKANASVRQKTEEVVSGCNTPQQKMEAIFNFMHNNIWPLFIPHLNVLPAAVVLAQTEGDCKDQVALTITMLRLVGISAYPVLIDPKPGEDIDISVPYLPEHIIVAVPQGNGWQFFDPNADMMYAADYLPLNDRDRHGVLILGKGAPGWIEVNTDKSLPSDTRMQTDAKYAITRDGELIGNVVTHTTGELAASRRRDFALYQDKMIAHYKGLLEYSSPRYATVTRFEIHHSDEYMAVDPFIMMIDFTESDFIQGGNEQTGYTSGKERWFTIPYPPSYNTYALTSIPANANSRYPCTIAPQQAELRIVVTVPSSFIIRLPTDVDITNAVGSVHVQYTVDGAGRVVVERTLEIDKSIIPPDRLLDLRALFIALVHDNQARIYLVPSVKKAAH